MDLRLFKSDMAQFGFSQSTGIPTGTGIDTWTEVTRPLEMRTKRSAEQPGTVEMVLPGIDATKSTPPLEQFQRIKVEDLDIEVTDPGKGILFIGRVDSILPRQDPGHGRVWVVKGRDYLAALVDNYVDIGKNRAFDSGGNPLAAATTGPKWLPKWIEKNQMDGQNTPLHLDGACTSAGTHCGTQRGFMVSELALNCVPLPFGLARVNLINQPNSLSVQYNFENVSNMRILDALHNIAKEDPWASAGPMFVDSKLAAANNGAIGGTFQIAYTESLGGAWQGQLGQYFRRGDFEWDSSVTFEYGVSNKGTIPIIGYAFPQEGQMLFSRAKAVGKGEAQDLDPKSGNPTGWGSGFVSASPALEGAWNPTAGEFAVMRGMDDSDSALIGTWNIDDPTALSENPLEIRGLRDRSAARILSFASPSSGGKDSVRGYRRGLHGSIKIPGYPRRFDNSSLIVGETIDIKIIPALGTDVLSFIIEDWSYSFPDNITMIQVSLQPTGSIHQVMGGWEQRHDQGGASHSDHWDSRWQKTAGVGNITLVHAMGVTPRTVIVYAAEDSGDLDADSNPVPVQNTKVEVPKLAYEAAQGQNFGFFTNRVDDLEVELGLAFWLADSSGAGDWMTDGDALIRVVLRP